MNLTEKYSGCADTYAEKQEEYIENSIKEWFKISKLDYNLLKVNPTLMRKVVERVYMRKAYYNVFHSDMKISEYKHCALTAYWIVKLKPFWIDVDSMDDNNIEICSYINEHIALGLLFGILSEFNEDSLKIGENLLSQYVEEMLYSVKFRDLNKESFIMLLDPFYYLYQRSSMITDDNGLRL